MSYAPVIARLGWIVTLFAVSMIVPALVSLGAGEGGDAAAFGGTALVALFFGMGLVLATQGGDHRIRRGEAFLLAVAPLPLLVVFAAPPFLLTGAVESVGDAVFEAVSGLTTTGSTVLTGLDGLGRGIVFWRSWLQWVGGLVMIVLVVSVYSMLEVGGMRAFQSAIPFGDHATVDARPWRTAAALGWVYALLTLVCGLALWSAGMSPFDAGNHALTTLSTGGFSSREGGVAAFDDPVIEIVLIVFMLIGATNATLFWAAFHGRPRPLKNDPELRWLLTVAAIAAAIVVATLAGRGMATDSALRHGVFAAVSALTTTGFTTTVTAPPPSLLALLFLGLMFIGGSTGSTAGGIKLMRVGLAMRQGRRELYRLAHPHGVVRVRYRGLAVPRGALESIWGYFIVFLLGFGLLSVLLAGFGLAPERALATALATITNAGAGLALVVGPESAQAPLPMAAKWVLSVAMLVGRLEFVVVIAAVTLAFRRS